MNKKYDDFQQKIKEWNKQGYDTNLLKGLYNLSNPADNSKVDYTNDLKKGTIYSNSNKEQFNSIFLNDKFKKLNSEQLKNVFQELHNRYVTSNGYEVSRNVVVDDDIKRQGVFGYVNSMDNMLFINKYAIDKAKNDNNLSQTSLNGKNIGVGLHFVITHESQHVCQFENAIDFANGIRKDPRSDFLAAMVAIEQANFAKVQADTNLLYFLKWKKNYNFQYIEHDANYKAFRETKSNFSQDEKFKQAYTDYLTFAGLISLRGLPILSIPKFINKRLDNIEKFAKFEINYFNKNIKDCPLKQELMETVNKYMSSDKKSESNFRKDLKNEISEILFDTMIKNYSGILEK